MAWINALRSISGLYKDFKVPQGSLNDFVHSPGVVGDIITQATVLNDQETHLKSDIEWSGAFGVNQSKILNALLADQSGTYHTGVHLFEFEVEKPEDAQYYKQTLCIYVDYECNADYEPVLDYNTTYFRIAITKFSRLEYATPTATPTETIIGNIGGAGITLIDTQGDYTVIPAAYSYSQGKWLLGFSPFTYGGVKYWGAYLYAEYENIAYEIDYAAYVMGAISEEAIAEAFDGFFVPEEIEDPNEEEPPEDGPGGGGSSGGDGEHILPDEPVPIPDLPPIGAADVSWLKLFKMTTAQLSDFGAQMTPKAAWQLLQAYFTNPLDAIIGILLIPVDAPTGGARTPAIGDFSWDKAYPIMNSEFYALDCGTITIPPYWDSAFDFGPFTRLQLFLPFIGYRDIDADEVMGGTIRIVYHIDLCTGDCTAFVARSASPSDTYGPRPEQVIAQYNGNCATRVPTGRINHDNAISAGLGLLGSAISVGGSIMGAALGQPGNISASQVANQVSGGTMTAVNGFKRQVQRSGNIAAAAGYMGITRPYIIRQIPHQDLPKEYKRLEGYPANKGGTLAQFAGTGLNTVEAMELTGFNGFESEREELLSILRGGVIV